MPAFGLQHPTIETLASSLPMPLLGSVIAILAEKLSRCQKPSVALEDPTIETLASSFRMPLLGSEIAVIA